ncbi:hypothetical protein AB4059_00550 [Lysobacter sp. 2RAF19]
METDRVYRADFGSYALWLTLLGIPLVPAAAVLAKFGWVEFQAKGMVMPVVFCLAAMATAFLWLSRYRLTFSSSGIAYRSWRRAWDVPYSDIGAIFPSRVAPISGVPIGVYVQIKGGRRELVYTKALSMAAINELLALAAASNE